MHDGDFDSTPMSDKDVFIFMIMVLCFMLGVVLLLALFIV